MSNWCRREGDLEGRLSQIWLKGIMLSLNIHGEIRPHLICISNSHLAVPPNDAFVALL